MDADTERVCYTDRWEKTISSDSCDDESDVGSAGGHGRNVIIHKEHPVRTAIRAVVGHRRESPFLFHDNEVADNDGQTVYVDRLEHILALDHEVLSNTSVIVNNVMSEDTDNIFSCDTSSDNLHQLHGSRVGAEELDDGRDENIDEHIERATTQFQQYDFPDLGQGKTLSLHYTERWERTEVKDFPVTQKIEMSTLFHPWKSALVTESLSPAHDAGNNIMKSSNNDDELTMKKERIGFKTVVPEVNWSSDVQFHDNRNQEARVSRQKVNITVENNSFPSPIAACDCYVNSNSTQGPQLERREHISVPDVATVFAEMTSIREDSSRSDVDNTQSAVETTCGEHDLSDLGLNGAVSHYTDRWERTQHVHDLTDNHIIVSRGNHPRESLQNQCSIFSINNYDTNKLKEKRDEGLNVAINNQEVIPLTDSPVITHGNYKGGNKTLVSSTHLEKRKIIEVKKNDFSTVDVRHTSYLNITLGSEKREHLLASELNAALLKPIDPDIIIRSRENDIFGISEFPVNLPLATSKEETIDYWSDDTSSNNMACDSHENYVQTRDYMFASDSNDSCLEDSLTCMSFTALVNSGSDAPKITLRPGTADTEVAVLNVTDLSCRQLGNQEEIRQKQTSDLQFCGTVNQIVFTTDINEYGDLPERGPDQILSFPMSEDVSTLDLTNQKFDSVGKSQELFYHVDGTSQVSRHTTVDSENDQSDWNAGDKEGDNRESDTHCIELLSEIQQNNSNEDENDINVLKKLKTGNNEDVEQRRDTEGVQGIDDTKYTVEQGDEEVNQTWIESNSEHKTCIHDMNSDKQLKADSMNEIIQESDIQHSSRNLETEFDMKLKLEKTKHFRIESRMDDSEEIDCVENDTGKQIESPIESLTNDREKVDTMDSTGSDMKLQDEESDYITQENTKDVLNRVDGIDTVVIQHKGSYENRIRNDVRDHGRTDDTEINDNLSVTKIDNVIHANHMHVSAVADDTECMIKGKRDANDLSIEDDMKDREDINGTENGLRATADDHVYIKPEIINTNDRRLDDIEMYVTQGDEAGGNKVDHEVTELVRKENTEQDINLNIADIDVTHESDIHRSGIIENTEHLICYRDDDTGDARFESDIDNAAGVQHTETGMRVKADDVVDSTLENVSENNIIVALTENVTRRDGVTDSVQAESNCQSKRGLHGIDKDNNILVEHMICITMETDTENRISKQSAEILTMLKKDCEDDIDNSEAIDDIELTVKQGDEFVDEFKIERYIRVLGGQNDTGCLENVNQSNEENNDNKIKNDNEDFTRTYRINETLLKDADVLHVRQGHFTEEREGPGDAEYVINHTEKDNDDRLEGDILDREQLSVTKMCVLQRENDSDGVWVQCHPGDTQKHMAEINLKLVAENTHFARKELHPEDTRRDIAEIDNELVENTEGIIENDIVDNHSINTTIYEKTETDEETYEGTENTRMHTLGDTYDGRIEGYINDCTWLNSTNYNVENEVQNTSALRIECDIIDKSGVEDRRDYIQLAACNVNHTSDIELRILWKDTSADRTGSDNEDNSRIDNPQTDGKKVEDSDYVSLENNMFNADKDSSINVNTEYTCDISQRTDVGLEVDETQFSEKSANHDGLQMEVNTARTNQTEYDTTLITEYIEDKIQTRVVAGSKTVNDTENIDLHGDGHINIGYGHEGYARKNEKEEDDNLKIENTDHDNTGSCTNKDAEYVMKTDTDSSGINDNTVHVLKQRADVTKYVIGNDRKDTKRHSEHLVKQREDNTEYVIHNNDGDFRRDHGTKCLINERSELTVYAIDNTLEHSRRDSNTELVINQRVVDTKYIMKNGNEDSRKDDTEHVVKKEFEDTEYIMKNNTEDFIRCNNTQFVAKQDCEDIECATENILKVYNSDCNKEFVVRQQNKETEGVIENNSENYIQNYAELVITQTDQNVGCEIENDIDYSRRDNVSERVVKQRGNNSEDDSRKDNDSELVVKQGDEDTEDSRQDNKMILVINETDGNSENIKEHDSEDCTRDDDTNENYIKHGDTELLDKHRIADIEHVLDNSIEDSKRDNETELLVKQKSEDTECVMQSQDSKTDKDIKLMIKQTNEETEYVMKIHSEHCQKDDTELVVKHVGKDTKYIIEKRIGDYERDGGTKLVINCRDENTEYDMRNNSEDCRNDDTECVVKQKSDDMQYVKDYGSKDCNKDTKNVINNDSADSTRDGDTRFVIKQGGGGTIYVMKNGNTDSGKDYTELIKQCRGNTAYIMESESGDSKRGEDSETVIKQEDDSTEFIVKSDGEDSGTGDTDSAVKLEGENAECIMKHDSNYSKRDGGTITVLKEGGEDTEYVMKNSRSGIGDTDHVVKQRVQNTEYVMENDSEDSARDGDIEHAVMPEGEDTECVIENYNEGDNTDCIVENNSENSSSDDTELVVKQGSGDTQYVRENYNEDSRKDDNTELVCKQKGEDTDIIIKNDISDSRRDVDMKHLVKQGGDNTEYVMNNANEDSRKNDTELLVKQKVEDTVYVMANESEDFRMDTDTQIVLKQRTEDTEYIMGNILDNSRTSSDTNFVTDQKNEDSGRCAYTHFVPEYSALSDSDNSRTGYREIFMKQEGENSEFVTEHTSEGSSKDDTGLQDDIIEYVTQNYNEKFRRNCNTKYVVKKESEITEYVMNNDSEDSRNCDKEIVVKQTDKNTNCCMENDIEDSKRNGNTELEAKLECEYTEYVMENISEGSRRHEDTELELKQESEDTEYIVENISYDSIKDDDTKHFAKQGCEDTENIENCSEDFRIHNDTEPVANKSCENIEYFWEIASKHTRIDDDVDCVIKSGCGGIESEDGIGDSKRYIDAKCMVKQKNEDSEYVIVNSSDYSRTNDTSVLLLNKKSKDIEYTIDYSGEDVLFDDDTRFVVNNSCENVEHIMKNNCDDFGGDYTECVVKQDNQDAEYVMANDSEDSTRCDNTEYVVKLENGNDEDVMENIQDSTTCDDTEIMKISGGEDTAFVTEDGTEDSESKSGSKLEVKQRNEHTDLVSTENIDQLTTYKLSEGNFYYEVGIQNNYVVNKQSSDYIEKSETVNGQVNSEMMNSEVPQSANKIKDPADIPASQFQYCAYGKHTYTPCVVTFGDMSSVNTDLDMKNKVSSDIFDNALSDLALRRPLIVESKVFLEDVVEKQSEAEHIVACSPFTSQGLGVQFSTSLSEVSATISEAHLLSEYDLLETSSRDQLKSLKLVELEDEKYKAEIDNLMSVNSESGDILKKSVVVDISIYTQQQQVNQHRRDLNQLMLAATKKQTHLQSAIQETENGMQYTKEIDSAEQRLQKWIVEDTRRLTTPSRFHMPVATDSIYKMMHTDTEPATDIESHRQLVAQIFNQRWQKTSTSSQTMITVSSIRKNWNTLYTILKVKENNFDLRTRKELVNVSAHANLRNTECLRQLENVQKIVLYLSECWNQLQKKEKQLQFNEILIFQLKYQSSLQNVSKLLDLVQQQLFCVPVSVEEQITHYEDLLEHIRSFQLEMTKINKVRDVLTSQRFTNEDLIEKSITSLNIRVNALKATVLSQLEDLQQENGQWKQIKDKIAELENQIHDTEKFFIAPVSQNPDQLLSDILEIDVRLKSCEAQIEDLRLEESKLLQSDLKEISSAQLANLQFRYVELHEKALERKVTVQNSLFLHDQYQKLLHEYELYLDIVQDKMQWDFLAARDLCHLRQQLTSHQEFFDDLEVRKTMLEALATQCDPSTKAKFQQQQSSLSSLTLVLLDQGTLYGQRLKYLVHQWAELNEKYFKLEKILNTIESQIPVQVFHGDSLTVIQEKCKKLKQLHSELSTERNLVFEIVDEVREILHSVSCPTLEILVTELADKWITMSDHITCKLKSAETLGDQRSVFETEAEILTSWLNAAMLKLANMKQLTSHDLQDIRTVRAKIKDVLELQKEVDNTIKLKHKVNAVGSQLLQNENCDQRNLSDRLCDYEVNWLQLQNGLSEVHKYLHKAHMHLMPCHEALNEVLSWVDEMSRMLLLDANKKTNTASDIEIMVNSYRVYNSDLANWEMMLAFVNQQVLDSEAEGHAVLYEKKEYIQTLGKLNKDWEKVTRDVTERLESLEIVLSDWEVYKTCFDSLHSWLLSQEDKIQQFKMIGCKLEVKHALQELQVTQKQFEIRQSDLISLKILGNQLTELNGHEPFKCSESVINSLSAIDHNWKRVQKQIQQHECLLNDALEQWNCYHRNLTCLHKIINQMEYALYQQTWTGGDMDILRSQATNVKNLQSNLNNSSHLESFCTLASQLQQICELNTQADIRKTVSDTQTKWMQLNIDLAGRYIQIEKCLDQWQDFENQYNRICDWLNFGENHCTDPINMFYDSKERSEALKKCKQLQQNLDRVQEHISELYRASDHFTKSAIIIVISRLSAIDQRMLTLRLKVSRNITALTKDVATHKQYRDIFQVVEHVLANAAGILAKHGSVSIDKNILKERLAAFKQLMLLFINNSVNLDTVNDLGHHLSLDEANASRLRNLNHEWQKLYEDAIDRIRILQSNLLLHQDFTSKCEMWITFETKTEQDLAAYVNGNLHDLLDQLHICQLCESEIFAREHILHDVINDGEKMMIAGEVEDETFHQKLHLMGEQFQSMFRRANQRKVMIRQLSSQWQEFNVLCQRLKNWLQDKENVLKNFESDLNSLHKQTILREKVKNIKQEFSLHENMYQKMCDLGAALLLRADETEAARIKDAVTSLQQLWDTILKSVDASQLHLNSLHHQCLQCEEVIHELLNWLRSIHIMLHKDIPATHEELLTDISRCEATLIGFKNFEDKHQLLLAKWKDLVRLIPRDGINIYPERIQLLDRQWVELQEQTILRKQKMTQALSRWINFAERMKSIIDWIDNFTVRARSNKDMHMENVLSKMQTEYKQNRQAKDFEKDEVILQGRQLMKISSEIQSSDIELKLVHLEEKWQQLQDILDARSDDTWQLQMTQLNDHERCSDQVATAQNVIESKVPSIQVASESAEVEDITIFNAKRNQNFPSGSPTICWQKNVNATYQMELRPVKSPTVIQKSFSTSRNISSSIITTRSSDQRSESSFLLDMTSPALSLETNTGPFSYTIFSAKASRKSTSQRIRDGIDGQATVGHDIEKSSKIEILLHQLVESLDNCDIKLTSLESALAANGDMEQKIHWYIKCETAVDHVERQDQLIKNETGFTAIESINTQVMILLRRWENLKRLALQQEFRLSEDKYDHVRFANEIDNILTWLLEAEALQSLHQSLPSDIAQLDVIIRQFKDFKIQLESKKVSVLFINLLSEKYLEAKSPESKLLQNQLDKMNSRWQLVLSRAKHTEKKLQVSLIQCQEFHHRMHDYQLWLENIETCIHTCKPTNLKKRKKYVKLLKLRDELQHSQPQLMSLRDTADQVLMNTESLEVSRARSKVHSLHSHMQRLVGLISSYSSTLEETLQTSSNRGSTVRRLFLGEKRSTHLEDSPVLRTRKESLFPPSWPPVSGVVPPVFHSRVQENDNLNIEPETAVTALQYSKHGVHSVLLMRVIRAALPIYLMFMLLFLLFCLLPVCENEYECMFGNNFHHSISPVLHYTDGAPPT